MTKCAWLVTLAIVVAAFPAFSAPNIVLIVADDLGWTDLGVYGSGYYQTPNIDRLAASGMKFTSAYASPNCAPTRASLLTGRYTPRHGIMTVGSPERGTARYRKLIPPKNRTTLALDEVTFAELLRRAGYATALMGKWHMGTGAFAPEAQGFALNIAGNDQGVVVPKARHLAGVRRGPDADPEMTIELEFHTGPSHEQEAEKEED